MVHRIRRYEANFLLFDFLIASCTAIVCIITISATIGLRGFATATADSKAVIYQSVFGLSGTLLGFVISATSIMLAFGESERFRLLKESGHYGTMFATYFNAMRWLAILIAVSLAALFLDTKESPRAYLLMLMLWPAAIVTVRVYRCVWMLKRLSQIAMADQSAAGRRSHQSASAA